MKLSKYKLAVLALITANIIWGASFPIYKWSLENVQPFTFSFLRLFLASIVILPFTLHKLHIKKEDILKLLALSFFGVTVPITSIFLGLELASSINAPLILSSGPIVLIFFAMLFLKEHPKKKVIYGTLLSLFGVFIVIFRPILENGVDGSIIGNMFFVITVLGVVVHTLLLKKMTRNYDVMTLTFWYFFLSSLPLLPMVFFESQNAGGFLPQLNIQGLIGILFGVFFASAIGHAISNFGIKNIPANEVGIFAYVDPIAAVLIAIPLLGETITLTYMLGALFVFLGIFIAEGRLHYHPFHKLKL